MSDHHQDLIDLISLVEEYKQHAVRSELEIKSHKSHIGELEKEIERLRAKELSHHAFVRELEESVRTLDRQLRQQHLAQSKKDEEIRLLKSQIIVMENQVNRAMGAEKRELENLRDERKQLKVQLTLKDQQLHEFEKQIDYQQTKILNMKAASHFMKSRADEDSDDDSGKGGSKSPSSTKKVNKNKNTSNIAPTPQENVGLTLYPIGEESPIRSMTAQSPTSEGRKSGVGGSPPAQGPTSTKALKNEIQPQPQLSKSLSTGSSSPRSGKVEIINDSSEFGAEPLGSTIFSSMLGRASSMESPPRNSSSVLNAGNGNKWASPRDDSPIAVVKASKSPVKSPSKPPKPAKRQPSTQAPLGISLGIDLLSTSRESASKVNDTSISTFDKRNDVTLDSGVGLHHSMEQTQWQTELYGEGKANSAIHDSVHELPKERTSVESVRTPDTLSPPLSPGTRLVESSGSISGGVRGNNEDNSADWMAEAKQKAQGFVKDTPGIEKRAERGSGCGQDATEEEEEEEEKEVEGKEETETGAKSEISKPVKSERRLKTLSSIKAIMNKSRMSRGLSTASVSRGDSVPLPTDMSFERPEAKEDSSDASDAASAAVLREYIRKSKETRD